MNNKNILLSRYPALAECESEIDRALSMMLHCYTTGGKILLCGNGGSCADCEHISGELLKGFLSRRPIPMEDRSKLAKAYPDGKELASELQRGIPAIPLPAFTSLLTAYANDVSPDLVYAQLVYSLGKKNDLLIGISTSGNSKNVVAAAKVAKSIDIPVIALTGQEGGSLRTIADCTVCAPANETFMIQEYHLPIYHYLCAELERIVFEGGNI